MSLTKVSGSMIQGWQVTPEEFGAVGNGVADDGPAFIAACNYCSQTGATLWLSPKVYNKARVEVHGTYSVIGNGATVMYLGVGQTIVAGTGTGTAAVPTPWPTDSGYQPAYPATTQYTLTVAPSKGAVQITLASVTGITAGMYLFICGNPSSFSSAGNFIPRDFEFCIVESVVGNVVNLKAPLQSDYLTTQSGVFYTPGLAINCHVSGLVLNTTTDAYQQVVRSSYGCTISNITLAGTNAPGASTFSDGLVYENIVVSNTGGGGFSTARGTVSTVFRNINMKNYIQTAGFFLEESFYKVTLDNYFAASGFAAGSMDCTGTQRKRVVEINNSIFNPSVYGGLYSPFSVGTFAGADIVCTNSYFIGAVTTPNSGNYPGITGNALIWVSGNQTSDIVSFSNCQFSSSNSGNTWPSNISGFLGTVKFDAMCSFVTSTAPSQIVPISEKGAWTPIVYGSSTVGTTTYTLQSGQYAREGNIVTVNFEVTWSSATGTGNYTIGGLPYTAGTNYGITAVYTGAGTIATAVGFKVVTSSATAAGNSAIAGSGSLLGVLTYIV